MVDQVHNSKEAQFLFLNLNNIEQNNTKVIKERLEALKLYINTMLEDNIPRNAIIETTDKVLL